LFLLLITQFLFFSPGGGQSVHGAMLLWPRLVSGGTAVLRSSPGPRLPKLSGCQPLAAPGALLLSPFNVRWRFSALTGDVEGSKLCLFSVIMPAKCVSSVSPRFHYRRVAFCFLPLDQVIKFFEYTHTYTCIHTYTYIYSMPLIDLCMCTFYNPCHQLK
jgi:hypothetical protein